jgi:hypothetical protein
MRYRSSIAAAALLLVFVAPPVTARANPCGPVGTLPDTPATTKFYQDNVLLGPKPLPQKVPVVPLLDQYQRFGQMSLASFNHQFIKPLPGTAGAWIWPPGTDGFDFKKGPPFGVPDRTKITLKPGTVLDRFGYATGRFLAPVGVSFSSRALPPQALDTPDHAGTWKDYEGKTGAGIQNLIIPPSNYHVYCVQNAFSVDAGPIAPWFGQPGRGTQYVLAAGYVPDDPSDQVNVQWLLTHGPTSVGPTNPYLVEQYPLPR